MTTTVDLPGVFVSDPKVILDTLKLNETDYHGTHCAAIAVGSTIDQLKGDAGGPLGGMAPDADIVLANDDPSDAQGLFAGSKNIGYARTVSMYALRHYAEQQGKPLVLSISSNDHKGFHDGTSTNARIVGNYCKAGNIMALCASNEGNLNIFLERKINAGKTLSIWLEPNTTKTELLTYLKTSKEVKVDIGIIDCAQGNKLVYEGNLKLTSDPDKTGDDYKKLDISFEFSETAGMQYKGLTEAQKELAKKLSDYFMSLSLQIEIAQGIGIDEDGNPMTYTEL